MAKSGQAKKHVFCSDGTVAGMGCKTLARGLAKSWYTVSKVQICLAANGPAIWGGCVTRRKHRSRPVFFSQKAVTVQGGYGVVFAIRVQILLNITRVAIQV
jgi:hypothetical protein